MDLATIGALYRYNSWATEEVLGGVSRVTPADFTPGPEEQLRVHP
jgi:hypothetical protein